MASLYRLATGAILEATPRKVVIASFSHSAVLSSAALSAEPFEAPGVPEIFDIFDAPVKLRQRNTSNEPLKTLSSVSTACVTSRAGRLHPVNAYNNALDLPWSLPPPITFDGPACPPHMSPSSLRKRRLQRQNFTRSLRGDHRSSAVSCSAFTSTSEPLYQLFDGPSSVTRYRYPTSQNEVCSGITFLLFRHSLIALIHQRYSFTHVSLALCLSSAIGWLAFKDNLDLFQQNNLRSP